MLSYSFRLTPAQTKMLLTIAYWHFTDDDDRCVIPKWKSPSAGGADHFISIARNLEAKGLIAHDPKAKPTFQATAMGRAFADAILREANEIVQMSEGVSARRKQFLKVPVKKPTNA